VGASSPGVGQGSEFTVRLPVLEGPADGADDGQGPSGSAEGERPGGVRILVVDDNDDNARSLAMLLRLLGHDVRVAGDGASALAEVGRHRPRLVLLDIGLPGMSGYEVAARLRERPEMAGAVLVAMTGYGQPEDRRRSEEAGFDGHLVKPVDPDALGALLSSVGPPARSAAGMPGSVVGNR
jgi:two-component system CheB/CheR fusion protein